MSSARLPHKWVRALLPMSAFSVLSESPPSQPRPSRKLIGQLLLQAGLITETQLEDALRVQLEKGGKLVEILVSLGYLSAEEFVQFLSRQPGVASINLLNYYISPEITTLVPLEFAVAHEVFPIDHMGKLLTLGMVCPLDSTTIQELEQQTNLRIKPILCKADDIRQAIRRHYGTLWEVKPAPAPPESPADEVQDLEVSLRLSSIARMIDLIETLPAMPETVDRLRDIMADPEQPLSAAANAISLDPPIAAKLLGVVNSAAFALPRRVDDIKTAVSLLGIRETYSLVLSCSVFNAFEKSKTLDYRAFWMDSMLCASAVRLVAEASGHANRFGIVAAGLLHDLWHAALCEAVPQLYGRIDGRLRGEALLENELNVLGISHAEAGYHLAIAWGLPIEIAEPIRFHHAPALATEARENVAVTAIAAAMSRSMSLPEVEETDVLEGLESALEILCLNSDKARRIWEGFLGHDTAREDLRQ